MHLFGDESEKEVHARLYAVMEGQDDPKGEHTLRGVMEKVQHVLDACYALCVNPLPALRQALGKYMWEYHRVHTRGELGRIVADSDFVWLVTEVKDLNDGHSVDIVTAKMTYRIFDPRFSWFWVGVQQQSEPVTPLREFARGVGGNLVGYHQ